MQQKWPKSSAVTASAMAPVPTVESVLRPLPPRALGWICLGYHASDSLGRIPLISRLLQAAGEDPQLCSETVVRQVLQQTLSQAPQWITLRPSPFAAVEPVHWPGRPLGILAMNRAEYAPCTVSHCDCGAQLVRWRVCDATFFTLARGAVPGKVLFLRCDLCRTVFGGCWRWRNVAADSHFPAGFHTVWFMGFPNINVKWFFASFPQCSVQHVID